MKSEYQPDDLLPLSGLQHFLFCRRQWALIQIERQWEDNLLTAEGKVLHERVNDPFSTERREGVIIARSVPIASYRLGLSGVCDVVEFVPAEEGIKLPGYDGWYSSFPVEYKRGKPKPIPSDEAQLCAQAMCLEEMLTTSIQVGYLFYWEIRHRISVELSPALRNLVSNSAEEMHAYFRRGYTPRVKPFRGCRSCSLADICLPLLQEKVIPASQYIQQQIENA